MFAGKVLVYLLRGEVRYKHREPAYIFARD